MPQSPAFSVIPPRFPRREDCEFYHSFTLPDETVDGQWDLRAAADAYLGEVDFKDRSVLEIGPASGYLSFHMERAGAAVTCIEPPMSHLWDIVPFRNFNIDGWKAEFTPHLEGVRNSFWYCHALFESNVRMIETDPYAIPAEIGEYDIGLLASVLLHCRVPFSLLEQTAKRVRKTMIVTETYYPHLGDRAVCELLPHLGAQQVHTWWAFSPAFFVSALGILGFSDVRLSFHTQRAPISGGEVSMFSVIASRPEAAA
ncbi:hypothetical protein GCM10011497_24420 [Elstera cyanobacteriorum]|uniref:Methyltransferase type 11 domain-containing protein n=1 Tax=Elstera cyanobacteriorum TaxID=2022747 RepID=A0A255XLW3_9PROT|nr:hypothetical protein [Elstera cyanobacteriorum]OYQ17384.1 hypothetical protein CHR90_15615 [Elstera cyanobacteriorum]GFZ93432.1 hypothetical protein GCM10011497_24420 [Elstera cyanobacteriorum]